MKVLSFCFLINFTEIKVNIQSIHIEDQSNIINRVNSLESEAEERPKHEHLYTASTYSEDQDFETLQDEVEDNKVNQI